MSRDHWPRPRRPADSPRRATGLIRRRALAIRCRLEVPRVKGSVPRKPQVDRSNQIGRRLADGARFERRMPPGEVLVRDVATITPGNHAWRNRPLRNQRRQGMCMTANIAEHGLGPRFPPCGRRRRSRGPAIRRPAAKSRNSRARFRHLTRCSPDWPSACYDGNPLSIFLLLAANFQSWRLSVDNRLDGPCGDCGRGCDALSDRAPR